MNRRMRNRMSGGVGGGNRKEPPYPIAPGMARFLGGESPLLAVATGRVSRRQGRRGDAGSEGSRRRTAVPTNRNRIAGWRGGVTRQWTGTPDSRSDARAGKSGGRSRVLPWETSSPVAKLATTGCEPGRGGVSGGHSSRKAKGRIVTARSSQGRLDERGEADKDRQPARFVWAMDTGTPRGGNRGRRHRVPVR
jgi:hypothetical protein